MMSILFLQITLYDSLHIPFVTSHLLIASAKGKKIILLEGASTVDFSLSSEWPHNHFYMGSIKWTSMCYKTLNFTHTWVFEQDYSERYEALLWTEI